MGPGAIRLAVGAARRLLAAQNVWQRLLILHLLQAQPVILEGAGFIPLLLAPDMQPGPQLLIFSPVEYPAWTSSA